MYAYKETYGIQAKYHDQLKEKMDEHFQNKKPQHTLRNPIGTTDKLRIDNKILRKLLNCNKLRLGHPAAVPADPISKEQEISIYIYLYIYIHIHIYILGNNLWRCSQDLVVWRYATDRVLTNPFFSSGN